MPVVFQLSQPDFQFLTQQVLGVQGVVAQHLVHPKELRLLVHNHAGVRRNGNLAVGEGVEGIDGLVRRHVVGQVDDDFGLLRGQVLNFLDFNLALVLGLHYGLHQQLGGLSVRHLRDGNSVLVNLFEFCTHFHHSAPATVVVA